MRVSKNWVVALALAGLMAMGSSTEAKVGLGVRGGFVSDSSFNQIFAGAHLLLSEVVPSVEHLNFEPSAEVGFGDNATTLRFNGNFKWMLQLGDGSPLKLYPIGGLALYHISLDCPEGLDCSSNEFGVNLGGGFQYDRFGADITLGLGDIPELTLTGYLNLR